MNTYLAFNSDGSLFQECTIKDIPDDGKTYIDISTLDPRPDIFSKIYNLVNNTVQASDPPEVVVSDTILLRDIRIKRNQLLDESDWTQVPDSSANTSEWATYRQALRDMMDGVDVNNVTWPTPPT